MMYRTAIFATALFAVAGCASTQRLASYGMNNAQAQIVVEGRKMNVFSHPTDQALLISKTLGDASAGGAIEGLTFGLARGHKPDPRAIDTAVAAFLAPVGCTSRPVAEVGSGDVQYEARFTCPAEVNLRALMFAQKAELMAGAPLHR